MRLAMIQCPVLGKPDLDVIHNVTGIAVSPEGETLTPLSLSITVVICFRVQCADKD